MHDAQLPRGKQVVDGTAACRFSKPGGIGITPYMSIAREAPHARREQSLTLVYSHRGPDDARFLDGLATCAALERVGVGKSDLRGNPFSGH